MTIENTAPEGTEDTVPTEPTESEVRARAQGWVPKDEWNGEGKWRTADEYNDRGELFAKIDRQRREVDSLRKTQQAFQTHLETVRRTEYQKALVTLREEKRDALRDGDADAVIAAEDKMNALSEQRRVEQIQAQQAAVVQEPHANFVEWQSRNQWYGPHNLAMADFADAEGRRLTAQGSLSPDQILKEVETRVRKEFPQKFVNPNREKPGAVESSSRGTPKAESYPLTDMERRIMNQLVSAKVLTKEQYIADLKANSKG